MDKKLTDSVNKYIDKCGKLNRLLITAFVKNNALDVKTGVLSSYIIKEDASLDDFKDVVSIEDVINIFELAVPKDEQTANGAVYTPKYIRDYVVRYVFKNSKSTLSRCFCADLSCGCGAFLYTAAKYIHENTDMAFSSIVKHLYGVDISRTSIERARILLSLAALIAGEELEDSSLRLYVGDSLTFNFMSLPNIADNGGFDVIVGNPPYVRAKHIDDATKANLHRWSTAKVGNTDLYIPFFELGYSLLNENGLLGYITVNTFFKSVNARALRRFFSEKMVSMSIINFGQQMVFKKKLAYTCLAFISRNRTKHIKYANGTINDIEAQRLMDFNDIDYSNLDDHKGWNLNRMDILNNIHKIEQTGTPLGDKYIIKNGIATLANNVYIFRPIYSDDLFYYIVRESVEYRIEKALCRDIIKPNILKTEADIKDKEEKIIYPYDSKFNLLPEEELKEKYPDAYHYLQNYRHLLDARDKGDGDYAAWYAYGRNQALVDRGKKLLFPYMSDFPHFVYTSQKDMMIYCGYAIYNDSEMELLILKKLLESSLFYYYIKNTSKPYSTGYFSYAKNYVKSFGVYPFNEEEKKHLLSLSDRHEIDEFIADRYRIVM